ncbi:hypothetical protein NDU88_005063 [Pleurodeles waltl]|uniref:Uncharacterized protein n=1 Tax=Pleurodeles waltl TaxID=8319 RepID=A0AAV7QGR8_PLEWA|nr:hypothetical protein NDU88_005063 [Pleurodeles waltl]
MSVMPVGNTGQARSVSPTGITHIGVRAMRVLTLMSVMVVGDTGRVLPMSPTGITHIGVRTMRVLTSMAVMQAGDPGPCAERVPDLYFAYGG